MIRFRRGLREGLAERWEARRMRCNRMSVSAFMLCLLAASPMAVAEEEWKLFAQVQGDLAALDLASIERADNLFFVEYRLALANATEARFGQGSVSELRKKLALSCGQPRVAVVDVREIDADGGLVGRGSVPREQWKFFEPAAGGMEWRVRQLVCRTYTERARNVDAVPPGGRPTAAPVNGELVLRPAKALDVKQAPQ